MPDQPATPPRPGPPDTTRQYRLTAFERDTLARAVMHRISSAQDHDLTS